MDCKNNNKTRYSVEVTSYFRRSVETKCTLFSKRLSGLLAATALIMSFGANADIGATHTTLISEFASFNTPGVVDGRVEAIAIDGDTVFVGGTFTQIQEPLDGEIINQPYLFAYSKSSGNIIREFDPVLNREVYALETTGDGTGVFAGGLFNILNGESNRRGLVKIGPNGDRVSGFGARLDGLVRTLVRLDDTLYVGGNFSEISNTPIDRLAAIDTTSGTVLPELNLDFDGVITTFAAPNAVLSVDDIDITSDGQLMVVIGNFQRIDNISRTRMAVIELDGQARVSTWNSNVYDIQCPVQRLPQYIRGVDVAPDDSYFVVGSQGFRIPGEPACDTIVRFDFDDLSDTDVQPTWVNFTGGDSVYEVVSTDHAVYVGGHFRWLTNDATTRGDRAGPGAQERRGLGALDPVNGLALLNWRSDRTPRGVGVFAMIAEDEGLYIGDDTDFLNESEHQKLKFLPVTTNTITRPDAPALPATIFSVDNNVLTGSSFNGTNFSAPVALLNTGFNNVRGAMFIGGQLFHADVNDNVWMSRFNSGTFEPRVAVDLFGLTDNEWDIDRVSGMFFDYQWSRVYYTLQGDSRLFYRAFTPAGPYFGNDRFVAEEQGDILWSDVSGMDVVDGYLYFARNNGTLFRAEIEGAAVTAGTTEAISGPGIDGRRWDNRSLAFMDLSATGLDPRQDPGTVAELIEFESDGSQTNGRFRTFEFPVTPGEPVAVRLEWQDPSASLNIFVRDANGVLVASDNTSVGSPKFVTAPAGAGGTYTASVLVREGATPYTLQINPVAGPPQASAVFEFSSSGSQTQGRFQVFDFDVQAGDFVGAQVTWDDNNADVSVFLRDQAGNQVDRDTDGSGLGFVSTIAQTSGQWSIAVQVNNASVVNYDVLVDASGNLTAPVPLADFEFSSSGSRNDGRFQRFNFDVVAGDSVEALVDWDDANADVRVFLRDENGDQVDRDTTGNGSGMVSTIAASSGRWSVAVQVNSTSLVNYDILVDAN